jgi:hypothetical protein
VDPQTGRRACALISTLFFAAGLAVAQTFFEFALDQDNLQGAPDFSFLNQPLTPADRVFVRDQRFFKVGPDLTPFTDDDQRVTFFGVNLAFRANFPDERDAARIARRLRRLGVNLVRLHHLDTQPDSLPANAGSVLLAAPFPTFNDIALARLRKFIEALAAEGIYVNLNLHVGYTFDPSRDGVPPLPDGRRMPNQSKPLHMVHPRMIEAQAEFARRLITALELKDHPALAMVEINNESSLLWHWQVNDLDRWIQGEYRDALTRRWNQYLSARYGATDQLRQAWSGGSDDGPELLPGTWRLEVHSPSSASLTQEGGQAAVRIAQSGAPIIVKQVGFSVAASQAYRVEFEIRADLPDGVSRNVYWDVKQDVSPWRSIFGRTISVNNQWQKVSSVVVATFDMQGIGRLGISVENVGATVYVRSARLYAAGRRGLAAGETLEQANVSLVSENELAVEARQKDYLRFLAAADKYYLETILAAVRESAGPLVPVAGTQMGYGGLMNLDSHATLDYQDHHYYVDHYNFPNVSWDGRDWRIRDVSHIGSGLAVLLNVAAARPGDRPFTVSEFNQPWPNTYAAETDVTAAVLGAFQDWDALMHFAYSHGRAWDDGVPSGFDLVGDWTKFVNFGQAAWLFRSRAIQPGRQSLDIPVSEEIRLRATLQRSTYTISSFLQSALGYDPAVALLHPVRLKMDDSLQLPSEARTASSPYQADTGEFTYDRSARRLLIHASQAAGIFGFVPAEQPVTAGPLSLQLSSSARGFVSLLVTALDGRPLPESQRLLVTNPGYTLRTQPGSTPPRPQQLVRYPNTTDWWTLEPEPAFANKPSGNLNGGLRPVWMERVEVKLTLPGSFSSVTVYPLDGAGRRLQPLGPERMTSTESALTIHLQAEGDPWSPWYEVIRE